MDFCLLPTLTKSLPDHNKIAVCDTIFIRARTRHSQESSEEFMLNAQRSAFAGIPSLEERWHYPAPHGYSLLADLHALRLNPGLSLAAPSTSQPLNNDVSSRFGRRLRELRKERNLTQTDMARRFGIDRSYISDVERGRKSVSLPTLEIMSLGLKVSLSDLFRDL